MEGIKAEIFLSHRDFLMFEKILNPSVDYNKREKWLEEYNEIFDMFLENNLNMRMNMKKRFCVLLMLYPMNEKEKIVFFKLNEDGKVGYLSKYLIKKSYSCNVPKAVIDKYKGLKEEYNIFRTRTSIGCDSLRPVKDNLEDFTYMMMDICYEKNSRSGKLDNLLGY